MKNIDTVLVSYPAFSTALIDLTGIASLRSEDPTWSNLFDYSVLPLLIQNSRVLNDFSKKFAENNSSSGNLLTLIDQINRRLEIALSKRGEVDQIVINQCSLGLFLLSSFLHYFFSHYDRNAIYEILILPIHWPDDLNSAFASDRSALIYENLIDLVIKIISHQREEWLELKLQATDFMISLCSPALYHSVYNSDDNIFQKYLFKVCTSELKLALSYPADSNVFGSLKVVRFVKALLTNSVSYMNPLHSIVNNTLLSTVSKSVQETEASLVDRFQKMFYGVLETMSLNWLASPVNEYEQRVKQINIILENIQNNRHLPLPSLPERSVQLLLLFLHQRRLVEHGSFNPFREVLNLTLDHRIDTETITNQHDIDMLNSRTSYSQQFTINKLHVDFLFILNQLSFLVPNHNYTLLLYSFLQMHSTFLDIAQATGYIELLVIQCLEGLYEECFSRQIKLKAKEKLEPNNSQSNTSDFIPPSYYMNHIYTLLICILLIVQDGVLAPGIFSQIFHVPWLTGTSTRRLKLIDIMVLVLLKVLSYATFRHPDQYIQSNIAAIFMNIMPHTTDLHPYTCERLIKTIVSHAKRMNKHHTASASHDFTSFQGPELDVSWHSTAGVTPSGFSGVKVTRNDHIWTSNIGASNNRKEEPITTLPRTLSTDSLASNHTLASQSLDDLEQTLQNKEIIKASLMCLLQYLHSLLSDNVDRNVSLVYSMLQNYDSFIASLNRLRSLETNDMLLLSEPTDMSYSTVIHQVLKLSSKYLSILKPSSHSLSESQDEFENNTIDESDDVIMTFSNAKEAMEYLRQGIFKIRSVESKQDPNDDWELEAQQSFKDIKKPRIRFSYQEVENPDAFFLPYIWLNLVISRQEFGWNWDKIEILLPDEDQDF